MLRNCEIRQLKTYTNDNVHKIPFRQKVNIDTFTNWGYHVCMRMFAHNPLWFANNITQPGKNVRRKKQ